MGELRVLIVDDEPDIRESLRQWLEACLPIAADCIEDGETAWRWLQDHKADLVVTDYRMPGMDGLALMKKVRGRFPDMPVFLVTAYPDKALARDVEQMGGRFFSKPVDMESLAAAVEEVTATIAVP